MLAGSRRSSFSIHYRDRTLTKLNRADLMLTHLHDADLSLLMLATESREAQIS